MNKTEKILSTVTLGLVAVLVWWNVAHRMNDFEKARTDAVTYSTAQAHKADSLLTMANAAQSRSEALTGELRRLHGVTATLEAQNTTLRNRVFKPDGTSALPDTCAPALALIHGQDILIDTLKQTVAVGEARHMEDSTTVFNLRGSLRIQTDRGDSLTRWIGNIKLPGQCSWLGLPCPSRKTALVIGVIGTVAMYSRHSITPYLHLP